MGQKVLVVSSFDATLAAAWVAVTHCFGAGAATCAPSTAPSDAHLRALHRFRGCSDRSVRLFAGKAAALARVSMRGRDRKVARTGEGGVAMDAHDSKGQGASPEAGAGAGSVGERGEEMWEGSRGGDAEMEAGGVPMRGDSDDDGGGGEGEGGRGEGEGGAGAALQALAAGEARGGVAEASGRGAGDGVSPRDGTSRRAKRRRGSRRGSRKGQGDGRAQAVVGRVLREARRAARAGGEDESLAEPGVVAARLAMLAEWLEAREGREEGRRGAGRDAGAGLAEVEAAIKAWGKSRRGGERGRGAGEGGGEGRRGVRANDGDASLGSRGAEDMATALAMAYAAGESAAVAVGGEAAGADGSDGVAALAEAVAAALDAWGSPAGPRLDAEVDFLSDAGLGDGEDGAWAGAMSGGSSDNEGDEGWGPPPSNLASEAPSDGEGVATGDGGAWGGAEGGEGEGESEGFWRQVRELLGSPGVTPPEQLQRYARVGELCRERWGEGDWWARVRPYTVAPPRRFPGSQAKGAGEPSSGDGVAGAWVEALRGVVESMGGREAGAAGACVGHTSAGDGEGGGGAVREPFVFLTHPRHLGLATDLSCVGAVVVLDGVGSGGEEWRALGRALGLGPASHRHAMPVYRLYCKGTVEERMLWANQHDEVRSFSLCVCVCVLPSVLSVNASCDSWR